MQLGERELQIIQVQRICHNVKQGFTIHVSVYLQFLWSFFFFSCSSAKGTKSNYGNVS